MTKSGNGQGVEAARLRHGPNKARTVIITSPPWPRSGTARVIQSQVAYYRSRGFFTVLICVPVHCSFTSSHPDWETLADGIQDLGADRTFTAFIDAHAFLVGKYTNWIRTVFRGTALDWIVFTAKSSRLPESALDLFRQCSVALIHANHVFTLGFAQYLRRKIAARSDEIPLILETHDIQSHRLMERGEINPWTHRPDTLGALLRSETRYLRQVDSLVHLSTDDLRFFQKVLPRQNHFLVLPTIDENFVLSVRSVEATKADVVDLLFVGQNTDFNCASIEWFLKRVWPLIANQNYRIRIAGAVDIRIRESSPAVYERFKEMFAGHVRDLAAAYRGARCVFAPMVLGTGISVKTIEALALGKPFVGTSKAFRGMPMDVIEGVGLHAYDSEEDFAKAISLALSDEQSAAQSSRAAYTRLFAMDASFAARDQSMSVLAMRGGALPRLFPMDSCRSVSIDTD